MSAKIEDEQLITLEYVQSIHNEIISLTDAVRNGSIDKATAKLKVKEYKLINKRIDKHIKEEINKLIDANQAVRQ